MAFVNRLNLVTPSFGTPISNDAQNYRATISLSAGPQSNSIPSSGSFAPPPKSGWVRVKIYNGGGANTTCQFSVSFTDGTNTVYIQDTTVAIPVPNTALGGLDFLLQFLLDIVPTSMTITTTVGGTTTTASMDVEVAYAN